MLVTVLGWQGDVTFAGVLKVSAAAAPFVLTDDEGVETIFEQPARACNQARDVIVDIAAADVAALLNGDTHCHVEASGNQAAFDLGERLAEQGW